MAVYGKIIIMAYFMFITLTQINIIFSSIKLVKYKIYDSQIFFSNMQLKNSPLTNLFLHEKRFSQRIFAIGSKQEHEQNISLFFIMC